MKARSVVFTHIQHPFTVFGLPPLMVVAATGAAMGVFVATMAAGAVAVSMIAFAATLAAGLMTAYRQGRRDRHVETVTLTALAFWGLSSRRRLLAGAAPEKSRAGDRP